MDSAGGSWAAAVQAAVVAARVGANSAKSSSRPAIAMWAILVGIVESEGK